MGNNESETFTNETCFLNVLCCISYQNLTKRCVIKRYRVISVFKFSTPHYREGKGKQQNNKNCTKIIFKK